jgi:Protein of unknown function (DUF1553)/Protein of unknown function (DUF1549)/Concanavalin A-like lectin/glucanases superfamily/Planctomycete cytochrome C
MQLMRCWRIFSPNVGTIVGPVALLVFNACLATAGDNIQYNRDIRPIFAENCFPCHGPDSAARKANLRLDRREVALEVGAVVPGKPEESELIRRIFAEDSAEVMPPTKSHKKLTSGQKKMLRDWIGAGAEYQPHWSLIAPRRPALPAVKDDSRLRNPIDRFILAKLEEQGLTFAPEADRRTLARRLSLDLTGLPPEPTLVEAFVQNSSPAAYEELVDQLMRSPHWGEHRGRYWLDAARYADTHGIHFDNFREMWSFRDWVIGAFNRNMPFDQFTVEQLAGDLLPNRTIDQQIASGFNRCNITTNEGGAINEEYLVLYTRDRTETTAQVWLGLTAGCAVCHDHKFDPLSQREFYELAAFFNNTTQAAMDGNIKDTPPVAVVPRAEEREHWQQIEGALADITRQLAARRTAVTPAFDAWFKDKAHAELSGRIPTRSLRMHATLSEGEGKTVGLELEGKQRQIELAKGITWADGAVAAKALKTQSGSTIEIADAGDLDFDRPFSYGTWVKLPRRNLTGALFARMDDQHDYRGWDLWIEGGRPGTHIIHKWQEDALKVIGKTPLKPNQWQHVLVTYDGSRQAAGVRVYVDGVRQETEVQADALKSTIHTDAPFKLAQRKTSSRLDNIQLQDLRVYDCALTRAEAGQLARTSRAAYLSDRPHEKLSTAERNEVFDWWLTNLDSEHPQMQKRKADLEQEQKEMKARGTVAFVMQEKNEKPMAFVLNRGEYDKRRDQVQPGTPAALPAWPRDLPRNRLGFARWLLLPDNPLISRVTVNRFWQEIYGTGLVRSAGDFGVTGEQPSHPELLDWLAVEFRESGWDVKRFFKMLVMSTAYRQSAAVTPEKLTKDPHNRLLSRGARFRMDAEMIRDYALEASGLLVDKLGGPSVKPYQPEGVWEAVAMIGSDTRDYRRDKGDKLYRRSMYTLWKRAAPPASMDIFNAPSRETCTVRRERTDTPLQALVTLNDPQFVEAARKLAEKTLREAKADTGKRLEFMAQRVLSRPLRPQEQELAEASLSQLLSHYQQHLDEGKKLLAVGESPVDTSLPAAELAAWTMLANEFLNLDEALNK